MILALALLLSLGAQAKAPAELYCDVGGGTKPAKLVVKADGGHRLFLCSTNSKKRHGKLEVSGFRVFMIGKSGRKMPKPLFESELDSKPYLVSAAGAELHADELVWDGKSNVPAFETVISCDSGGCHVTKPPKCVFEKPKAGSRRALEQVEAFQHGKKQGKVPPKKLVDSLAALAYSGDEDAQKIFQDRGALSLDGASSDAYFDHQASLDRLKKAGCL